jgi:hypothetical protein
MSEETMKLPLDEDFIDPWEKVVADELKLAYEEEEGEYLYDRWKDEHEEDK